jgi:hypothetical protein
MAKPAKKTLPAKRKRSPEPDVNQLAHYLVHKSTEETEPVEVQAPSQSEISRVMAELGRRGGRIGGKMRAAHMTEEQRSNAAALAARALWAKRKAAQVH